MRTPTSEAAWSEPPGRPRAQGESGRGSRIGQALAGAADACFFVPWGKRRASWAMLWMMPNGGSKAGTTWPSLSVDPGRMKPGKAARSAWPWVRKSSSALRANSNSRIPRQTYRTQVQQARASALLLQLIDELFDFPAITNPAICKRMNITPRSAQLNIDKLVERGIIREATGRQRNRVYVATEIVGMIERQES